MATPPDKGASWRQGGVSAPRDFPISLKRTISHVESHSLLESSSIVILANRFRVNVNILTAPATFPFFFFLNISVTLIYLQHYCIGYE
jgi:hypothetical protein